MKIENTEIVIHVPKIFYSIVATPEEYSVNFKVYQIDSLTENQSGDCDIPEFRKVDGGTTQNISEAEVFMQGHVKWDGCSNWSFVGAEQIMFHACTREELANVGLVMVGCWDLAKELLPNSIAES